MKAIRDTASGFKDFVAILKTNLSGWYVLLVLLLLSVLMSGCDDDLAVCPVDESCGTEVTAVSDGCAIGGAFGTISFVTQDGTYLEPWINETGVAEVEAGARYMIGYTPTKRDDRYKDDPRFLKNIVCCFGPGPQTVKVTCLTPVATTDI